MYHSSRGGPNPKPIKSPSPDSHQSTYNPPVSPKRLDFRRNRPPPLEDDLSGLYPNKSPKVNPNKTMPIDLMRGEPNSNYRTVPFGSSYTAAFYTQASPTNNQPYTPQMHLRTGNQSMASPTNFQSNSFGSTYPPADYSSAQQADYVYGPPPPIPLAPRESTASSDNKDKIINELRETIQEMGLALRQCNPSPTQHLEEKIRVLTLENQKLLNLIDRMRTNPSPSKGLNHTTPNKNNPQPNTSAHKRALQHQQGSSGLSSQESAIQDLKQRHRQEISSILNSQKLIVQKYKETEAQKRRLEFQINEGIQVPENFRKAVRVIEQRYESLIERLKERLLMSEHKLNIIESHLNLTDRANSEDRYNITTSRPIEQTPLSLPNAPVTKIHFDRRPQIYVEDGGDSQISLDKSKTMLAHLETQVNQLEQRLMDSEKQRKDEQTKYRLEIQSIRQLVSQEENQTLRSELTKVKSYAVQLMEEKKGLTLKLEEAISELAKYRSEKTPQEASPDVLLYESPKPQRGNRDNFSSPDKNKYEIQPTLVNNLSRLSSENDDLRNSHNTMLVQLKSQIQDLKDELEGYREKERNNMTRSEHRGNLNSAFQGNQHNNEIFSVKTTYEQLTETIGQLNQQIEKQKKQLEQLQEKELQMGGDLQQSNIDRDKLNWQLQQTKYQMQKEREQARIAFDQLSRTNESLYQSSDQLKIRLEQLQADRTRDKADFQQKIFELIQDNETFKAKLEIAATQLELANKGLLEADSHIEQWKMENTNLKQQNQELSQELQRKSMESLQTQKMQQQNELQRKSHELIQSNEALASCRQRLLEAEQQLGDSERKAKDYQDSSKFLTAQIESYKSRYLALFNSVKDVEADFIAEQTETETLRKQVAYMNNELARQQAEIASLQSTIEVFRKQLDDKKILFEQLLSTMGRDQKNSGERNQVTIQYSIRSRLRQLLETYKPEMQDTEYSVVISN